jgi:hypothetical protein
VKLLFHQGETFISSRRNFSTTKKQLLKDHDKARAAGSGAGSWG